jgi:hypothetical protein
MSRGQIADRNSLNGNRAFTSAQKSDGARLAALIIECASDLAKLEALLIKQGYGQDSLGQWFHSGQLVPSPSPSSTGVRAMAELA